MKQTRSERRRCISHKRFKTKLCPPVLRMQNEKIQLYKSSGECYIISVRATAKVQREKYFVFLSQDTLGGLKLFSLISQKKKSRLEIELWSVSQELEGENFEIYPQVIMSFIFTLFLLILTFYFCLHIYFSLQTAIVVTYLI